MPDENDIVYTQYGLDVDAIFRGFFSLFNNSAVQGGAIWEWFGTVWTIYSFLAFLASALFIFGTIKAYLVISDYGAKTDEALEAAHQMWRQLHNGTQAGDVRWQAVREHARSEQPNDWKLAIIEADILLGNALDAAGYRGSSIGEQLKSASATQLTSLQDAWDAHRVRNRVAHEGSDYVLTQSATQATIVKYERVLRELGIV